MKYSLRNLMIVAILGPPSLAGAWFLGHKLLAKPRKGSLSLDGRIIILVEEEVPASQATAPNPPKN